MKTHRSASAAAMLAMLNDLTPDELRALTDNPGEVKKLGAELFAKQIVDTFVVPLSDGEVKRRFPHLVGCLPSWRNVANRHGYSGPVAWLVREGFTLKEWAPMVGRCHAGVGDLLKHFGFIETPTEKCLVFWVPTVDTVEWDNTLLSLDWLEVRRGVLRNSYGVEFPESHATTFGSAELQFALIFAYYNLTGKRLLSQSRASKNPPDKRFYSSRSVCEYVISDSQTARGQFLIVGGWEVAGNGLSCIRWGGLPFEDGVGFMFFGMEKLEQ